MVAITTKFIRINEIGKTESEIERLTRMEKQ